MLNKIRKIKIYKRLVWSGGIIVTLVLISAIIGIISIYNVNQKFSLMLEDRYKKIEIISDINDQGNKIAEQFMEILLTRDPAKIESVFKNIYTNRNIILEKLHQLEGITYTDRGIKLLNNLRQSYNNCSSIENSFMQAVNENRLDKEAEHLFHNIKIQRLQCELNLKRLLEFQKIRMEEITTEIEYMLHNNMIIIGILGILISIIIVAIIWWIIFAIKTPVQKITTFVARINQGEIPAPLTESWEGEFDSIRKDINVMREAIYALYILDKSVSK